MPLTLQDEEGIASMSHWKEYILSCIWGPLLIAQIILVLFMGIYNESGLRIILYIGWFIWIVSVIFGWLPIFVLKKQGGVDKGKSYVHTTSLVTSGIYSIVRHPQYTAGILFSLALILISQSWLILIIGAVVITLLYFDIVMADRHERAKFGEEYERYMKDVPRTNFILGIIRLLERRGKKRE
jgi:protein-S-isoprenylcysteine O-methyltransferase Ste14